MIKLHFPSNTWFTTKPSGISLFLSGLSGSVVSFMFCLLLPLALEASMAATRPAIVSVNPPVFMQATDALQNKTETLEIKGYNFYITDPIRGGETIVYLRQGNTGYTQLDTPIIQASGPEGAEQTLIVHFPASKFLLNVSDLELMVVVGIHPSLPYTINVLPAPLRQADIVSIQPSTFLPPDELPKGTQPDDYYKFSVKISNPDEANNTTLTVAGRPVPIEGYDLGTGVIQATLPPGVRTYNDPIPVQVSTRKGISVARYIRIVPVAP